MNQNKLKELIEKYGTLVKGDDGNVYAMFQGAAFGAIVTEIAGEVIGDLQKKISDDIAKGNEAFYKQFGPGLARAHSLVGVMKGTSFVQGEEENG